MGGRLGDVAGVVGSSFGIFEVNATQQATVTPGGLGAALIWTSRASMTRSAAIMSHSSVCSIWTDDAEPQLE